jgi:hypothetical protein
MILLDGCKQLIFNVMSQLDFWSIGGTVSLRDLTRNVRNSLKFDLRIYDKLLRPFLAWFFEVYWYFKFVQKGR